MMIESQSFMIHSGIKHSVKSCKADAMTLSAEQRIMNYHCQLFKVKFLMTIAKAKFFSILFYQSLNLKFSNLFNILP